MALSTIGPYGQAIPFHRLRRPFGNLCAQPWVQPRCRNHYREGRNRDPTPRRSICLRRGKLAPLGDPATWGQVLPKSWAIASHCCQGTDTISNLPCLVLSQCPRRDSNSHPRRDQILSLARLPFHHQGVWLVPLRGHSIYANERESKPRSDFYVGTLGPPHRHFTRIDVKYKRSDSNRHCTAFETVASYQLGYACIGTKDGIRTRTAQGLNLVPPAVGLP